MHCLPLQSSSVDVTDLEGAEDIVISSFGKDFGSCKNVQVEIVIADDPCAIGQHECNPIRADCTPTPDGLDYICTCKDMIKARDQQIHTIE